MPVVLSLIENLQFCCCTAIFPSLTGFQYQVHNLLTVYYALTSTISNEGVYFLGYSELQAGMRAITLKAFAIRRHAKLSRWEREENVNFLKMNFWAMSYGRPLAVEWHHVDYTQHFGPYSQFRKYIDFDKWDEQKALNIPTVPLPTSHERTWISNQQGFMD